MRRMDRWICSRQRGNITMTDGDAVNQMANRLELVASRARVLADDVRQGKLWGGKLERGIADIQHALTDTSALYNRTGGMMR